MLPKIINEINENLQGGRTAFILEWNTNDRLHVLNENIPPMSFINCLATYFNKKDYSIGLLTSDNMVIDINPPNSKNTNQNPFKNKKPYLSEIVKILRNKDNNVLLFIDYADLLVPCTNGAQIQFDKQNLLENLHKWAIDDDIKSANNIICLITRFDTVHNLLKKTGSFQTIQCPLPDFNTRKHFIDYLTTNPKIDNSKYAKLNTDLSSDKLAHFSNGLRLNDLEWLFRKKKNNFITKKDVQLVKSKTIKDMAGGLVEVIEPEKGFESLGGLESVKEYFRFIKWQLQNGSQSVPYAILLAGVPGTGKSSICNAMAAEMGLPLLILRNIFGKYVGESESNIERVIQIVESMSPCIVVIEEIDQGIGQRGSGESGDSGTSNRVSQRFWEAIGSGNKRGTNLWIGNTNRPDLLDAAMLDRFQVILPFLHPTPKEAVELLKFIAQSMNRKFEDESILRNIAYMRNLYLPTIRGISEIVTSAALRADFESKKIGSMIKSKNITAAAKDFKVTYDRNQHEYIALKCVSMVSFSSLMPWMDFKGIRSNYQIPNYLVNIVNGKTGEIDNNLLYLRIHELEKEIHYSKLR
ncbi:MAG: ATP-binding protein [Candidatus Atribacteria bacterium]|nr:ATP-binding protein [Candidatus Atribacteria bacterium]